MADSILNGEIFSSVSESRNVSSGSIGNSILGVEASKLACTVNCSVALATFCPSELLKFVSVIALLSFSSSSLLTAAVS